jgi:hypothetical protein
MNNIAEALKKIATTLTMHNARIAVIEQRTALYEVEKDQLTHQVELLKKRVDYLSSKREADDVITEMFDGKSTGLHKAQSTKGNS